MVIFGNLDGSLGTAVPEIVTQGSNGVQSIIFVAEAVSSYSTMSIDFELPNGQVINGGIMTPQDIVLDNKLYNAYYFKITEALTNTPGVVSIGFTVVDSNGEELNTYTAQMSVVETNEPVLPDVPDDDWYTEVLAAYAYLTGKVNELEDEVDDIVSGDTELPHYTDINAHQNIQDKIAQDITDKVTADITTHNEGESAHENRFALKQDKTPNGVNDLININYKIDDAYLPPFAVSGGLVFGGTFGADGLIVATSRTPELNGTLIDNITLATYPSIYFKATASYAFGGKSYDAGDIAICNGDITPNWTKIDGSDAVTGVKGNNEVAYRLGNVNITKDNIGLGEVDNTSDEDKPISTATKSYVDEELVKKANLDGATFTGNITIGSTETPKNLEVKGTTTVTAPTADLHAATKKYVDDAVVVNPIVTSWSDPLSDSNVPSEKLTKESLDLKADKVTSATNENFAGLDADGNLTDSGKKASDFIGADKLVTEFGETPLDTNVPSEKLVKDSLVPYEGATKDVDLGSKKLIFGDIKIYRDALDNSLVFEWEDEE